VTKANHVNLTATEIECGVGVQLKYPARIDGAERIQQPPRIRNIDVDNISGGVKFMTNNDRRVEIKMKSPFRLVVLLNQGVPVIFKRKRQKITI
jgi:hypothetical protein